MKVDRKYFNWVDIAKAISIFGVVYIHSGMTESETASLNNGSYFRFCVPIFIMLSFFLSEYYLQTKKDYSKKDFLKKRLTRLIIPYIGWSILYSVGQFYLGINPKLSFGTTYAWEGQYFFIVLIQLTLLYPWLRTFKINQWTLLLILGLTLIFIYLPQGYLGINIPFIFSGEAPFFYWLLYVFLAIFLARNLTKINQILSSISASIATIFIVLLPFFIVLESFFLKSSLPHLRISVLLVSPILIFLFMRFNSLPQPLSQVTRILSQYSLGIFCMNSIVIAAIEKSASYLRLHESIFSQTPALLTRFLLAGLACLVSILLCFLLERAKCGVFVK
jgi:surface polysaccharide O-acyltransferase-like enzyme